MRDKILNLLKGGDFVSGEKLAEQLFELFKNSEEVN